jgi:hypothetical protein
MIKSIFLAVLLCMIPVAATSQTSIHDITDITTEILEYIDTNSPVRMLTPHTKWLSTDGVELPDIVILPADDMVNVYREQAYVSQDQHHDIDHAVGAYYNIETQTIYFKDTIDVNTVEGQAIVLHELVHHVQQSNEITYDSCESIHMQERQAYAMQIKYMLANGYHKDDQLIIGLTWNKIYFGRSCRYRH